MPEEAVLREHLDRILESPGFQNSDRLSRFLRFTVEAAIRGERDQIKEYLIGREVFDRGDEYDPRLDPIVRVEARRLRKKLDEYYAATPPNSLRIDFPKGSYAPDFKSVQDAELPVALVTPTMSRRVTWQWIAGGVAALVLAGAAAVLWKPAAQPSGPLIAIVPARWIWKAEDFPAIRHDEQLAELLGASLVRRRAPFRVIAWPQLQKYRTGDPKLETITKELGLDQVIVLAVRVEADGFRVTAFQIDPKSGRKMNVEDAVAQPLVTLEDRRKAAESIAGQLTRSRP